jgi:hypothetical protein
VRLLLERTNRPNIIFVLVSAFDNQLHFTEHQLNLVIRVLIVLVRLRIILYGHGHLRVVQYDQVQLVLVQSQILEQSLLILEVAPHLLIQQQEVHIGT